MDPRAKPGREARRDPRALVCARALVETEGGRASEHLTYDLSAGGVRLCGIPRAHVGDRVRVVLQLPGTWVGANGRLLRVTRRARQPEFAIRFEGLDASSEDLIHDIVVEGLSRRGGRSVLLIHAPEDPRWRGWGCLAPISPICLSATTPLEAVRSLQEHDVSLALLGTPPADALRALDWKSAVPDPTWRLIDERGRLAFLRAACDPSPRR